MATTTAYVTLGRHDRHHTRRHAGHQATRQLLSQHLPTPGWPSLTLGPAGVATRTGHHTADSAPTIPRRLATPARNDSPHQPGPSLQGADKAIPLHINRLSFPTLSLCCIPFLSVRHAIQSLLIRLLVFVYSLWAPRTGPYNWRPCLFRHLESQQGKIRSKMYFV
jgi:hypothetical protein